MANSFGKDILIQCANPREAAEFYIKHLGFAVTSEVPMLELTGSNLNLYIDKGPTLGPVLELFVQSVETVKNELTANGCKIVRDEPEVPRCYVRDPFGLVYNLASK